MRLWRALRTAVLGAREPAPLSYWFVRLRRDRIGPQVDRHPHLAVKPLRPYLSLRWDRRRRIAALLDSHDVAASGPAILRLALALPHGISIARIDCGGTVCFELRLATDYRYRKEGEWVLSLRDAQSCEQAPPLLSLAFAFRRGAGGRLACHIGCVQGTSGGRDAIREATRATRAMHGLRPAALLVLAARELALLSGARRLRAISDAAQVHRGKHLLHIPARHSLGFQYDELWKESGGRLRLDGWYDLPMQAAHRPRASVPARKRAEHARRCALIDRITAQLRAADSFPKAAA